MSKKRPHPDEALFGDDPEDETYGTRISPRKKQKKSSSSKPKPKRRPSYDDEDIEEDDDLSEVEDISDDEETSPVSRTQTGRPARRTTVKAKYEEPDSDEGLEDIENSDDERRQKRRAASSKPSLTVKLKVPKPSEPTRASTARRPSRSSNKSIETPAVRKSSRISHDESDPLVSLTASGRHQKVERTSSATPEPSTRRPARAPGMRVPTTSVIDEASIEDSQEHQVAGLTQQSGDIEGQPDSQQYAQSVEQIPAVEDADMAEAEPPHVAESVHDEDDEDPVQGTSRRRSQRLTQPSAVVPPAPTIRSSRRTRRGGIEEKDTSDFEPELAADDPDDEGMSQSDESPQKRSQPSEASSQQGRRSGRLAKKRTSQRAGATSPEESELDRDELAEEAAELKASRRRNGRGRRTSPGITYDQPRLREREKKDYRVYRPELALAVEEEDGPSLTAAELRKGRGQGRNYRSLYSTQGPFGGAAVTPVTHPGGIAAVGGADSDSSDDELTRQAARAVGGALGMTPTAAVGHSLFPQNVSSDAILGGLAAPATSVGKIKDKKLLADADPLGVDQNVNFDGVGGLGDHINQLKEMVMLPLLYPEIFQRMHITPPRGVLFHGPPGTGKTLLARALASSVSSQGKKVTFYMRKGADALSKWVGEAERQLRTLFEEARKTQPSIIFFDEIDGLAPVRSSRQEQIHASIVATLLALMDGMDGRGQVIVIGATNRPDSVDPALRRPGRFDREFYFPLPNVAARRAIIDIHTKGWDPELKPQFKDQLAELTKGYGGADLRALCTEAALNAVQGTYPQIYHSNEKLIIDPANIKVLAKDFMVSVNKMIPSSERSAPSGAAPLETSVEPLLRDALAKVSQLLDDILPENKKLSALEEAEYGDRDDEAGFDREIMQQTFNRARVFRPRLLVYGAQGMGQQYVGGAILNKFERLFVQSMDLSNLFGEAGRSPEAAVVQLFNEARRHKPSVIYIPNVDVWYRTVGESVVRLFTGLLRSLPPNDPVLVLGIMEFDAGDDKEQQKLDPSLLKDLFGYSSTTHVKLDVPNSAQRFEYFQKAFTMIETPPTEFPELENRKKRILPQLLPAPPEEVEQKSLTKAELKQQKKNDRMILNYLKIKIQPIIDQLKRAYRKFVRPPIDPENFEYLFDEQDHTMVSTNLAVEQIEGQYRPYEMSKDERGVEGIREVATGRFYYNLELITIERRFVNGYYKRPKDFLADIKRLVKDASMLGEADRIIKANQMLTNVETDIDMIERTELVLVAECEKVYTREQQRAATQVENARQAEREGREVPTIVPNVPPPEVSHTTTETSGPIVIGGIVPGRPSVPISQFPRSPVSNGFYHGSDPSHGSDPLRIGYDTEMSNSLDLPQLPAGSDPNASRSQGTQPQRVQKTAFTPMAQGSQAADYYNDASTTTSGKKSDERSQQHRSSGVTSNGTQSNATQSSNGTGRTGHPDFNATQQYSGTPLPDTQEMNYGSGSSQSQPSSQFSQPSQQQPGLRTLPAAITTTVAPGSQSLGGGHASMAPPSSANPSRGSNLQHILNDSEPPTAPRSQSPNHHVPTPTLVLDRPWLEVLHKQFVDASSGFSVEQLEQMMSAIMGAVWKGRLEWNRTRLAMSVKDVFNRTVADIEGMQKIAKASQETEGESSMEGGLAHPPSSGERVRIVGAASI